MRLVIASSPRLASPDVVFPPRIALCVTFWSFHARCKPDGRTGRGHWRGGRVHELRVEGEEGIRNGHRLVRRHVCSPFAWSCEMKERIKKKGDKRKKKKERDALKMKIPSRRFRSAVCIARGIFRRMEISLARFSAAKMFPAQPEGNIWRRPFRVTKLVPQRDRGTVL